MLTQGEKATSTRIIAIDKVRKDLERWRSRVHESAQRRNKAPLTLTPRNGGMLCRASPSSVILGVFHHGATGTKVFTENVLNIDGSVHCTSRLSAGLQRD